MDWFIFFRPISEKFTPSAFFLLHSVFPIPGVYSRNKIYRASAVSDLQPDLHYAQRNKIYCVHFVKKSTFGFFKPKDVYDI